MHIKGASLIGHLFKLLLHTLLLHGGQWLESTGTVAIAPEADGDRVGAGVGNSRGSVFGLVE